MGVEPMSSSQLNAVWHNFKRASAVAVGACRTLAMRRAVASASKSQTSQAASQGFGIQ